MLSEDKIISIYCFVDDLLKGLERQEDIRRKVSDSEIITTAIVSALYFGGHSDNGRHFMKMTGLCYNSENRDHSIPLPPDKIASVNQSFYCSTINKKGD